MTDEVQTPAESQTIWYVDRAGNRLSIALVAADYDSACNLFLHLTSGNVIVDAPEEEVPAPPVKGTK